MCERCYAFEVLDTVDFFGQWTGWKLRGRCLITPDGVRLPRIALQGIAIRWWLGFYRQEPKASQEQKQHGCAPRQMRGQTKALDRPRARRRARRALLRSP